MSEQPLRNMAFGTTTAPSPCGTPAATQKHSIWHDHRAVAMRDAIKDRLVVLVYTLDDLVCYTCLLGGVMHIDD